MDKRLDYYISRKNVFTWIAALALVASSILRVYSAIGQELMTDQVWYLVVLPVAASVIYMLIILINGEEQFYKTSIPVVMFCIYYAIKIANSGYTLKMELLYWIACLAVAYFYCHMASGKATKWFLILVLTVVLGVSIFLGRRYLIDKVTSTTIAVAPDLLALAGGICALLAVDIHLDGKYHPTWGDRTDGRKVRGMLPMTTVTPFIMPTRTGSSNSFYDSVEISDIEKYIIEKRKEGYKGFGVTHIFLAAYVRCVAKYPAINRFCSGQRVYTHGDDIQFCMVVKTAMKLDADESIMKLHLKPTDTVFDVYEKYNAEVERIRTAGEDQGSDFDKVEKLLAITPRLIMSIIMALLRFMDYYGLIPLFLLELSPFHGSVFFTSMASLGIPPVVHHLYDFGNLPVFCCLGAKRTEYEADPNPLLGVHTRHYLDYTFNTDERICDGFYYASVSKYLKRILANPRVLETPPEEVKKDID